MAELTYQIEKMEKEIKSLVANQKSLKEEIKNNNAVVKKEIKDAICMLLERRLDKKIDILNKRQKDLDDKMSTTTQNINTITQNLSTMRQNQCRNNRFNDILIYSKTWEEHLQHLEIVLKTLQV